jgi:hypothetical protein
MEKKKVTKKNKNKLLNLKKKKKKYRDRKNMYLVNSYSQVHNLFFFKNVYKTQR